MTNATHGYSGTPLAKKLGIVAETNVVPIGAPEEYLSWLDPLPEGVTFGKRESKTTDLVHVFTKDRADLEKRLIRLRSSLRDDASVWVSWPKKASKVTTDITEDVIREIALPLGFVDIKVCAVSEIWSGLKLVVRKELRGK
ncbi:MAG: DUF3052 family protein [Planctomycetaceae bacterium]|nr:DUF3052 family protein [Planctomycetaceae bacterium]